MRSLSTKEYLLVFVLVVGVSALCFIGRIYLPLFRVAENWVSDLRVATLTPNAAQSELIVVVAINEDTLAELSYRSPVDRQFLSKLLRTLETKGVRALGIDLLFDQPTEPDKDEEFRTTLDGLNVPFVVAWADTKDGLTERQISFMDQYLSGIPRGLARVFKDPHDGTVRTMLVRYDRQGDSELSLAASLTNKVGHELPSETKLPLRYRGWPESGAVHFATFPAHTIEHLPDDWLKDRIVLIGADLPLDDRHRTPLSVGVRGQAEMAGVYIHAHALSQLLQSSQPRFLFWLEEFAVYILFGFLGVLLALAPLPVIARGLISLVVIILCWAAGALLFNQSGIMVPLVMPTLTFMISAGAVTAWMWRQEQAQRKFVTAAFGKYLSPVVIDKLVANPDQLRLGGERREMTFLFTDLAGFTSLTEQTDPEMLVQLLNHYLDGVCDIAIAYGGTIDKIVGDALHVIFNAPLDQANHAECAVTCALAMDQFCQSYRTAKQAGDIELGVTRIGINTGWASVGNFGGEKRFDYTAHGDPINVAARLESLNKYFGTRICVSQTTVDQAQNVSFRPMGDVILKGKTEGISVYEPYYDDDSCHDQTPIEEYQTAYELLRLKDSNVRDRFDKLTREYPGDSLIAFHSQRLNAGEVGHRITMKDK